MEQLFTAHDAHQLSLKSDVFQLDIKFVFPILKEIKKVCLQGEFEYDIPDFIFLNVKQRNYIVGRLKANGYVCDADDNGLYITW